jgi:hypothetical protein
MEYDTQTRMNRVFIAVALVLSVTLVSGLLGIAGLVLYKFLAVPVEVAMPPEVGTPTSVPVTPATFTPITLPGATATAVSVLPTPTLVIAAASPTPAGEGAGSAPAQGGPGMTSPGPESSAMPESGLGPLQTLAAGLTLICLLGGARMIRRIRGDKQV